MNHITKDISYYRGSEKNSCVGHPNIGIYALHDRQWRIFRPKIKVKYICGKRVPHWIAWLNEVKQVNASGATELKAIENLIDIYPQLG